MSNTAVKQESKTKSRIKELEGTISQLKSEAIGLNARITELEESAKRRTSVEASSTPSQPSTSKYIFERKALTMAAIGCTLFRFHEFLSLSPEANLAIGACLFFAADKFAEPFDARFSLFVDTLKTQLASILEKGAALLYAFFLESLNFIKSAGKHIVALGTEIAHLKWKLLNLITDQRITMSLVIIALSFALAHFGRPEFFRTTDLINNASTQLSAWQLDVMLKDLVTNLYIQIGVSLYAVLLAIGILNTAVNKFTSYYYSTPGETPR